MVWYLVNYMFMGILMYVIRQVASDCHVMRHGAGSVCIYI
jgi:hypothetical protein